MIKGGATDQVFHFCWIHKADSPWYSGGQAVQIWQSGDTWLEQIAQKRESPDGVGGNHVHSVYMQYIA